MKINDELIDEFIEYFKENETNQEVLDNINNECNNNVTVFVPQSTPKSKIEKIQYYGANVQVVGKDYDDTHEIAMDYLKKNDLTFIDPCSDIEVIAGQGTIAFEILEQNPEIDTLHNLSPHTCSAEIPAPWR
jgi:threonine synthase